MPSSVSRPCRRSCTLLAIMALAAMISWPTAWAEPPAERLSPRSVEFEGVEDKLPMGFRDIAALAALFHQVQSAPPAELANTARRDVGIAEISTQPAAYRGALIELRGFARRVYAASGFGDRKGLFEVWITIPLDGPNPFPCLVEKLPGDFPLKESVSEAVVFRGFFLKLIPYSAGDVRRVAPLLVGRLESPTDRQLAGLTPAGPNDRLPSAPATRDGPSLTEDRIPIELIPQDRLIVDGQPIARNALVPRLEILAERTRRNAQAAHVAIESAQGLAAVLTFRASAETPFAAIARIVSACDASGFRRFELHLNTDPGRAAQQRPVRRLPAPEQRTETDLPETIRTVPILLLSDGTGRIGRAEIGENIFQGFAALERELGSMFTDPDLPFDQVKLDVDPKLHYSEVVQLTRVLAGLSVTKIFIMSTDK
jgi:biopolymer transport protein ExbD